MYHPSVLVDVQRKLEMQDAVEGAERYLEAQLKTANREGFERRDDVQKIIRGAIPLVSAGIQQWIETASAKRGRPSAALAPLKEVDPDVIALGALSKTFNTVAKRLTLPATAASIGRTIQVEVEALLIEQADPKAADKFLKMAEGESSERANMIRHERLQEALELGLGWSQRTQVLVGAVVLNVILKVMADVFEQVFLIDERGKVACVRLTEEAIEHIGDMAEAAAWTRPLLRPMIVQPRKWTHFDTGGYLEYQLSKTVPLVRTFNRDHQKIIREAIKDGSMQPVLDAVNLIQETRFAIDKRVLDVVMWVKEEGHRPIESFPLTHQPEKMAKVPSKEWEELAPEARSALSRRRKSVTDIRLASAVNCAVFQSDIAEALRLTLFDAFYLPASLDSRGRVYAVPHFNPQRSDHIKALFRFADTVPMGRDGGYWLSIHLANCGDFGKVSKQTFDARVQWVRDNEGMILLAARDPQGTFDWWGKADSPFCFLQACFEYEEWMRSGFSEDFESCISVALDGSCSGLQHYAAMTRSEEEGRHVNLVPRDTVGDIYNVVANEARPTLEAISLSDAPHAAACKIILDNEFGRSDVKRNVMTYFYGSGKFGMRDQHMVDTMRPLADKVALGELQKHPYEMLTQRTDKETGEVTERLDGGFTCAQVLASHVYQAVVTVAPKADEAASWFQTVASILAHESLPVIWRTPMGMPVMQRYSEYTCKEVTLWLYDRKVKVPAGFDKQDEDGSVLKRIQCLLREAPTKRIDKKKARSAISPNVVHSLDAAHLQRVVVMAAAEGIVAFQLIHDSFATHAGNTGRFFRIIREAFVAQYENYCPFQDLIRHSWAALSEEGREKLPAIPCPGTLELSAVLGSLYAFA